MTIVFITGLSGVGKSSTLEYLSNQSYNVIDTDYGYTKIINGETVWDEDKITNLIENNQHSQLFISGCYSNQAKFYSYFDYIVLLTADLNVMLDRVKKRTSNNYGKSKSDKVEIIDSYIEILPLLRTNADIIIDTSVNEIEIICEQLKQLLLNN